MEQTELLDKYTPQEDLPLLSMEPGNLSTDIGFRAADFTWSKEVDSGKLTPSRRRFRLHIEDELLFKPGCINLILGPTGEVTRTALEALAKVT